MRNLSCSRSVVAAAFVGLPCLGFAQQYTLQKTNSIGLSSSFFSSNDLLGQPGSDYGTFPLSIGFDGANAYVGGYHSDTGTLASGKAGVLQLANVLGLAPTVNPIVGSVFNITQNTRGIDSIAAFDGDVFIQHDNSAGTDFVRRMTPAGATLWQVAPPAFQRIGYAAIDPRGDAGQPALGFLARASGRMQALRLSDGAHILTQSGGATPGPIYDPSPSTIGYTQRGMFYDANGNLAYSAANGFGVSLRASGGAFTALDGTAGTTRSLIKSPSLDNVGNGVALLENAGGSGLEIMAVSGRVGGDATIGFNGTFTSSTGAAAAFDARWVQLRNLDGNPLGLVQQQLFGDEDGIGTRYTGEIKNFAAARDANGNPILLVVSFADRRVDVYQLEPTWTGASGDWNNAANWRVGLIPDSALLNARFGDPIGSASAAITLSDQRTVKNLKFDNASTSYTISGGGTLTIDAPAGVAGQISVVAGNHNVNTAITLAKDLNIRVERTEDTLTLGGDVLAAGRGITKRGPGLASLKNVRASALNVAEGAVAISGTGSIGASRVADLSIANSAGSYSATLDLGTSGIIVANTPVADVRAAIVAGRNGGAWDGNGVTSSAAAANSGTTAVGYAVAGDIGATLFLGQIVTATDTLTRYTRLGDANLDGITDIGDFSLLAANFNQAGEWSDGDSNYDGVTDIGDFALLAANFNQGVADLPRGGAVPEPAVGALAAGIAAAARRRRRR